MQPMQRLASNDPRTIPTPNFTPPSQAASSSISLTSDMASLSIASVQQAKAVPKPVADLQLLRSRSSSGSEIKRVQLAAEEELACKAPLKQRALGSGSPPRSNSQILRRNSSQSVKVTQVERERYAKTGSPTRRKIEDYSKNDLSLLSEADIRNMNPSEQLKLSALLDVYITKEPLESQSMLQRAKSLVFETQEKIRNEELLFKIEKNTDNIWDALFVCSDSITSPENLFRIILNTFNRLEQGSPRTKPILHLLFCIKWVEQNKETKSLEKAKATLLLISQIAMRDYSEQVKQYGEKLHVALNEPTPRRMSTSSSNPAPVQKPASDIYQLLLQIREGQLKAPYNECVQHIAQDLWIFLETTISKITRHHFIKKWSEDNPEVINRYCTFFDSLSFYFVDTLLRKKVSEHERDAEIAKVAKVLCFYLDLAAACLDRRNFAAAACITIALNHGAILRLKESWSHIFKTKKYAHLTERLNTLFSGIGNFKELRELHESARITKKPYICHLLIYQKDLAALRENRPPITQASEEYLPLYNFDKLFDMKKLAESALDCQSQFDTESEQKHLYYTNLFTTVVQTANPLAESMRYEHSNDLEPSLRRASGSSLSISPRTTE